MHDSALDHPRSTLPPRAHNPGPDCLPCLAPLLALDPGGGASGAAGWDPHKVPCSRAPHFPRAIGAVDHAPFDEKRWGQYAGVDGGGDKVLRESGFAEGADAGETGPIQPTLNLRQRYLRCRLSAAQRHGPAADAPSVGSALLTASE